MISQELRDQAIAFIRDEFYGCQIVDKLLQAINDYETKEQREAALKGEPAIRPVEITDGKVVVL